MPDKIEEKASAEEEVASDEETSDEPVVDRRAAEEDVEEGPASGPVDPTPEQAAQAQRAADMGIVGDPDAEPGYYVDENFRPNPTDIGSLVTTEHHGGSSYDLKGHSGLFANAGADPLEGVEVPPSPEPPPPMGATDYIADPTQVPGAEEAQAQQEASMEQALAAQEPPEGEEGDPKVAAAKAKADATVESAEETAAAVDEVQNPSKAQGAKKAAPTSPAGTKDTALEADPKK